MNPPCVIGIGCDDHGDQIAGLLVARAVAATAVVPIAVHESSGAPGDMIAAWSGAVEAIVIEAMPEEVAGVVRRCVVRPRTPSDGHCASIRLSSRLRDALGQGPLPPRITIITIGGSCFVRDALASPAVVAAAAQVADGIVTDTAVTAPVVLPARAEVLV